MSSLGKWLREERLKQKKTLEEISEKTKIRPSILTFIEEGRFDQLPSRTYVQGFVKAYAQALKLDLNKAAAFFRREYDVRADQEEKTPPQPLDKPRFIITPSMLLTLGGTLLLIFFFVFLFWQYRQFAGRPVLLVDQPADQTVTSTSFIQVGGRTDPDVQIFVNGEEISVSKDGSFQIGVTLQQGPNRIIITARNQIGKETTIEREVRVIAENT